MRITVAILPVMQPDPLRDHFPQQLHHIGLHTLIPVLLDHDRGGRALSVHTHQAVANSTSVHDALHLCSDVDQFLPVVRADGNRFTHGACPSYANVR